MGENSIVMSANKTRLIFRSIATVLFLLIAFALLYLRSDGMILSSNSTAAKENCLETNNQTFLLHIGQSYTNGLFHIRLDEIRKESKKYYRAELTSRSFGAFGSLLLPIDRKKPSKETSPYDDGNPDDYAPIKSAHTVCKKEVTLTCKGFEQKIACYVSQY